MRVEETGKENGILNLLLTSEKDRCGLDILWLPVLEEFFSSEFEGIETIILSLSNIHYIDSSALWKLVDYTRSFQDRSITFQISHVNEHIMRILNLTRLMDKIHVVPESE